MSLIVAHWGVPMTMTLEPRTPKSASIAKRFLPVLKKNFDAHREYMTK
jgi:hypothetical protein